MFTKSRKGHACVRLFQTSLRPKSAIGTGENKREGMSRWLQQSSDGRGRDRLRDVPKKCLRRRLQQNDNNNCPKFSVWLLCLQNAVQPPFYGFSALIWSKYVFWGLNLRGCAHDITVTWTPAYQKHQYVKEDFISDGIYAGTLTVC